MAKVAVPMPKMGESITEGTVIVWHKSVGDPVALDETLVEIGTDKVDTDVPSPASGIVAELVADEGATVPVGDPIAYIETETGDAPDDPAEPPTREVADSAPESGGDEIPVVMPKMGESITEGTVNEWRKSVGDTVELDETLLEIGTDKVDTDVPSPAAGVLARILVPAGETVPVGTPVAVIVAGGRTARSPASEVRAPVPAPSRPEKPPEAARSTQPPERTESGAGPGPESPSRRHLEDGRFLSPLVRSIADSEGVPRSELATIQGSGRGGRITKQDLLAHVDARQSQPAPDTSDTVDVIPMDRMRQLIAEHMVDSRRTSAHVTSFCEVDVTHLVQIRERNKAAYLQRNGLKLTYTPFLVHAAVEALRDYPLLNASVEGTNILVKKEFHIGIAVAIGTGGLIVPVIRHAGRYSIDGLAHAAADLAERARSMELLPDDLQGGTFTLTNVGSLGSLMGTPIILQPQVAILATGTIQKRPVVIEDPVHGDLIGIRHMMILSLSYDHRIIDGAMGIAFLRRLTEVIEGLDPAMEI